MDLLKIYNTNMETNKTEEIKEFKKGAWINLVNPSESEIKKVCETLKLGEELGRVPILSFLTLMPVIKKILRNY